MEGVVIHSTITGRIDPALPKALICVKGFAVLSELTQVQDFQRRPTRTGYLIHTALPWSLVRTPADQFGAMTKTAAGEVIVAHLDDQFRPKRFPFRGPFSGPAAGSARRVAGETGRFNEWREFCKQRFALRRFEPGTETHVVQQSCVVVQT